MRATRLLQSLTVVALAIFGFALCLAYGHLGLNPLDDSIVFDGGWRIASGQLPFRDFSTPVGIVPSAMQAALFSLFGISWFVYCVHAAIVNGAFAVVACDVARRLHASFLTACLVGVASAIVFYPPIGVPYSDQHSFFFSLCCLWTTLVGIGRGRLARWALATTPAVAALALLSKPVPAAFVVGPCLLVAAVVGLRREPLLAILGFLLPLGGAVLYASAIQASPHDLVLFLWTLPYRTATTRTVLFPGQNTASLVGFRLHYIVGEWLEAIVVTRALVVGLWLATLVLWTVRRARMGSGLDGDVGVPLGLSVWLTLATGAFTYVTNNKVANALALLPLVVLLAWLAFSRAFDALCAARQGRARTVHATVAMLVLLAAGTDAWRFNQIVNAGRAFARFNPAGTRWSPGGRLQFLRMQRGTYRFDVRDILPYIASRPDNFLLLGDTALLYGATGHPSVFPSLWLHTGLTLPARGSGEYAEFETRLLASVERFHVRYIVQEDLRSKMDVGLDDFPRLVRRVADCPMQMIGAWTVREICR